MAMSPTASAAPMPDDAAPADDAAAPAVDTGADEPGDENVLLTVCKEADGTYSLIKGDEQDADGADTAGSADVAGSPEQSNKQTFDSVGSLLKGILDLLNEDKSSAGGPGDADDQFNAGFDENAPAKPASPIPQKY